MLDASHASAKGVNCTACGSEIACASASTMRVRVQCECEYNASASKIASASITASASKTASASNVASASKVADTRNHECGNAQKFCDQHEASLLKLVRDTVLVKERLALPKDG